MTNRDFYLAISAISERNRSYNRTLEQYLLALLGVARNHYNQNTETLLSPDDVCQMLSDAFTTKPLPFEADWREDYSKLNPAQSGFTGWEATLIRQIVDLREMEEAGTLNDPDRYFGIKSPRVSLWYNFVPTTYLECGTTGSLGGWEPEDTTGRQFVPGSVVAFDSEGHFQSMDPQDVERPIFEMAEFSWGAISRLP